MSTNGIYGLSGSGIDVESMVKAGMLGKQNQYDKLYKKEVQNEWLKEAYANIYSELQTFNMSTMSGYKMSSKTNPMLAASTATAIVTATANADAANMSHNVTVSSVSSNAYLLTKDKIARNNTSASSSMYLKDIIAGSTEITEAQYKALGDDAKAEKAKEIALSFEISNGTADAEGTTTSTISFTYGDLFDSEQTLNDLASKINKAGVNMTASYDAANDAFSIYQKDGGSANQINLAVKNRTGAETKDEVTTNAKADDAARALLNNLNLAQVVSKSENGNVTTSLTELNTFNENDTITKDVTGNSTISGTGSLTGTKDGLTETTALGDLLGSTAADGISFTIRNGTDTKTLTYSQADLSTKTIDDLMTDIGATGLDITAELKDGKLTLSSTDADKTISLGVESNDTSAQAASSREFLNAFGFSTDSLTADTKETVQSSRQSIGGTDGKVTIDGKDYTTTGSKVTVANVTYNVASVGSATVSVSQDTDTLINNVKQFVTDYNKMIDELNSKYNETQYSSYGVLTKSQESKMTADQIKQWNEKAKSGLLYHDKNIASIISSMREALYTPVSSVDSKYNTMMSIGITSSTDQGHLKLDEDKLKKALADDPDSVRQLFASSGEVTDPKTGKTTTDYSQQGVVNRIYDGVSKNLVTMKGYAGTSSEASDGSTLGTLILELKTKMSNFKTLMDSYENKLFKQYDAMEVAIQRLSVSMNYITGSNN